MFIWEILDDGKLGRWGERWTRGDHRLYLSREAAEAKALPIVEQIHKDHIKQMLADMAYHEDALEVFGQEAIDFWKRGPPLTTHRTDGQTFYGCGDPEADSRSYMAAGYGWIKQREVVE